MSGAAPAAQSGLTVEYKLNVLTLLTFAISVASLARQIVN
jgi:hypothetical protein